MPSLMTSACMQEVDALHVLELHHSDLDGGRRLEGQHAVDRCGVLPPHTLSSGIHDLPQGWR